MTTSIQCDCGDCRACRRAMGFVPEPVKPVKLSDSTLRLLASLDEPKTAAPKQRVQSVIRHNPTVARRDYCKRDLHKLEGENVRERKRSSGGVVRECVPCMRDRVRAQRNVKPRVTEKPTPVPCVECGGMIGARRNGYAGWMLAEKDGKCEVCADRPKYEAFLAEYALIPDGTRTTVQIGKASKARKHLERVLRDGRAFHERVPRHGAGQAYLKYGCRCRECSGWKTADNRARREGLS